MVYNIKMPQTNTCDEEKSTIMQFFKESSNWWKGVGKMVGSKPLSGTSDPYR